MSTIAIVIIIVAAVIVVGMVTALIAARRRRALKERFGPEYERVVESSESKREADRALRERVDERRSFNVQPLAPAVKDRYEQEWRAVQSQFVDVPETALTEADVLVTRLMRDLGYPIDDFDHQADLISVDHAEVVHSYRDGHSTYLQVTNGQGSTESIRQGFLSYRSLFAELLEDTGDREAAR